MSPSRYRGLDADHILATIRSVKRRIDNRFPTSGLEKDLLAGDSDLEEEGVDSMDRMTVES